MIEVLPPRVPMHAKALIKTLSTVVLESAEKALENSGKNIELLKRLAQIELPAELEHALLLSAITTFNAARNTGMVGMQVLTELDPKWADSPRTFPPAMTIEGQYADLKEWRAKYDRAVEASRLEVQRNAVAQWPATKKP